MACEHVLPSDMGYQTGAVPKSQEDEMISEQASLILLSLAEGSVERTLRARHRGWQRLAISLERDAHEDARLSLRWVKATRSVEVTQEFPR